MDRAGGAPLAALAKNQHPLIVGMMRSFTCTASRSFSINASAFMRPRPCKGR